MLALSIGLQPHKNPVSLKISHVPLAREIPSIVDDFKSGMLTAPREMPPKYFYDELGSQLFDQICQVRDYYPTRTERALIQENAQEILKLSIPEVILELGSGTSAKTRELLSQCPALGLTPAFWPFDVSEEILLQSAQSLDRDFPWMDVHVLIGDYTGGLAHLPDPGKCTLSVFLGGTIGNFSAQDAGLFLQDLRSHLTEGDHLLIGMDRVKSVEILEQAYNDSEGLTARFNLNLLTVLNRELGCDFDLQRFRHEAVFNHEHSRIEMYLVAQQDQCVQVAALDTQIELQSGERILTEISRKFDPSSRGRLLEEAGYREVRVFAPENDYFELVLARVQA